MFPGKSIKPHLDQITSLVTDTQSKSLLDYGCGQGKQYTENKVHERWGILPTLYDPASRKYRIKPEGTFDGVICTDVLEHVPEDELDDVLNDIFGYATKFVFLSISTVPARKKFDDGTNLHVTIRPEEWWLTKLSHFKNVLVRVKFQGDEKH